jgi:hypothetical protein
MLGVACAQVNPNLWVYQVLRKCARQDSNLRPTD